MLKMLNKSYGLIGIAIYLLFIPYVEVEYAFLHILNLVTFIFYFLSINYSLGFNSYTIRKLYLFVFLYSLISVILFNSISFIYNENFFVFSEADAVFYDSYSKSMASMSISDSIDYFLEILGIDDLGMVLVLSNLYRIIESNLFYNFFNLLLGLITVGAIFRISLQLMERKYAFLCALTFSISSYHLWFHASGLKESIMVTFVVLFFDQWYKYLNERKVKNIILGLIYASVFILFRPPITFFLIGSVGLASVYSRTTGFKKIISITGILLFLVVTFPLLEESFNRFLLGGDLQKLILIKEGEGMVIGGLRFTYAVNILSQLIGQLPTILPNSSTNLHFYSPGLIFKMLMSFSFIFGIYYIFKKKWNHLYPLLFFVLLESTSLVVILEGLELRKSTPHFPAIYIISFCVMNYLDTSKKVKVYFLYKMYALMAFFFIIAWNFRG